MPERIELLAPARNLECGMAAIDHGADAVYIGATQFGARAAAGNSVEDIAKLCAYAHQFGAKVDVTVNTILYDNELQQVEELIWDLYRVGVDALIVQDMALLSMNLPPIALHASTQMDNRTPEKVRRLRELGYQQVVLARELSLDQIREIHTEVPDIPLEAFVHGALCVSFSGQCYASQACFNRSANRGECAQFCRLGFDIEDAEGTVVSSGRYPLSLKDMNRSQYLEQMMDAGVRSFKIEGRLKDVSYVKNVTAYYRQKIDAILARRPEYERASLGRVSYTFQPDPQRSFNRGFTDYFLRGRSADIASPQSPKSVGQSVGYVKDVRRDCIVVAGTASFANGDGLCFYNATGALEGFRINRVEGNHLYPAKMPHIAPRTPLYRNFDQQWERLLSKPSAVRKIGVEWVLEDVPEGFRLTMIREDGRSYGVTFEAEHQLAKTDQKAGMEDILSRLGDTIYQADRIALHLSDQWFIPRSILVKVRNQILAHLFDEEQKQERPKSSITVAKRQQQGRLTYLANVSNRLAKSFYAAQGYDPIQPALEIADKGTADALMFCKHCIRYSMGYCPRHQGTKAPYREPYYLVSKDGRRFRLEFDCKNCQMIVRNA